MMELVSGQCRPEQKPSSRTLFYARYDATMDAQDGRHEPGEMPRPVAIVIIGETALDHLQEVARQIQDNVAQALAEDSKEN